MTRDENTQSWVLTDEMMGLELQAEIGRDLIRE